MVFAVLNVTIPQAMDNAIYVVSLHHFFVAFDLCDNNLEQINQLFVPIKISVPECEIISDFLLCGTNLFFDIGDFLEGHGFPFLVVGGLPLPVVDGGLVDTLGAGDNCGEEIGLLSLAGDGFQKAKSDQIRGNSIINGHGDLLGPGILG